MKTLFLKLLFLTFALSLHVSANTFQMKAWNMQGSAVKSQSTHFTMSSIIKKDISSEMIQSSSYKLMGGLYPLQERDVCLAPIIMYLLN